MTTLYRTTPADRLKAALPALLVHALIGLALLRGLSAAPPAADARDELKLIELAPEPPPPPPLVEQPSEGETRAARPADPRPEGAASPPNLTSRATEIVVPPPEIRLRVPSPVTAAPVVGTGLDPSSGNADTPGPGTGSGGIGEGTGSGARGGGGGAGGGGGWGDGRGLSPPRLLRGRIRDGDYPRGLGEAGIGGTVGVHFAVETDGRVTSCRVTSSSGSPLLDAHTCRLIEQRFRYDPSRDRSGRPVRSFIVENHEWVVEDLPPDPYEPPHRGRRSW